MREGHGSEAPPWRRIAVVSGVALLLGAALLVYTVHPLKERPQGPQTAVGYATPAPEPEPVPVKEPG
jgi:H+/Cl- antiporter ClcA